MHTVIVGAGISGLLLARELQARGEQITVLEKSRGFGGRLATKRVGTAVFDSGAQFMTAREPLFAALIEFWQQAGWVTPWPDAPQRRYLARPAMTGLPKALAEGLEIRREQRVTAARRVASGGWELSIENVPMPFACDRLLLTCPAPQALALLEAGGVELPATERSALEALTYHPCLALLVVLDAASEVPAEGVAVNEAPLRWLADNTKKGISPDVAAAVTVHAAPEFSAANYTEPEAVMTENLLAAARPWLGAGRVTATALHRWKFSEPKATHAQRSVWLPELRLGFAGDAFGGPKVEGAALSGLDLARRLGA